MGTRPNSRSSELGNADMGWATVGGMLGVGQGAQNPLCLSALSQLRGPLAQGNV